MGDVAIRLRTTSYILHVDAILRVQPSNLRILISLYSLRLGFFAVWEGGGDDHSAVRVVGCIIEWDTEGGNDASKRVIRLGGRRREAQMGTRLITWRWRELDPRKGSGA